MIDIGPELASVLRLLCWAIGFIGVAWACAWGTKE